jgi:uncharacterized membrane protein YeaQ/YmgE (transglycosylase-associated protein family)
MMLHYFNLADGVVGTVVGSISTGALPPEWPWRHPAIPLLCFFDAILGAVCSVLQL